MEGDTVTLHCRNNTDSSSNFTATFYKNDDLIGSSSTGNLTIHRVSKSDEGFYKCNISGVSGQSPDSLLTVRAGSPSLPADSSPRVILPVVGVCLMLILLMLLCLWRSHKDKVNPAVSYTDITVTQEVKPRTFRGKNIKTHSDTHSLSFKAQQRRFRITLLHILCHLSGAFKCYLNITQQVYYWRVEFKNKLCHTITMCILHWETLL
ncbi:unnamed protein product [Oreochromis niloticus]|nr:unnamed protein product [Mustela putorius furo]